MSPRGDMKVVNFFGGGGGTVREVGVTGAKFLEFWHQN